MKKFSLLVVVVLVAVLIMAYNLVQGDKNTRESILLQTQALDEVKLGKQAFLALADDADRSGRKDLSNLFGLNALTLAHEEAQLQSDLSRLKGWTDIANLGNAIFEWDGKGIINSLSGAFRAFDGISNRW